MEPSIQTSLVSKIGKLRGLQKLKRSGSKKELAMPWRSISNLRASLRHNLAGEKAHSHGSVCVTGFIAS